MTDSEDTNPFKTDIEVFLEVRIRDTIYSNRGNVNAPEESCIPVGSIADIAILRVTDEIREAIKNDN